jgi:DNA-binding NarL/FixJ family response regulator
MTHQCAVASARIIVADDHEAIRNRLREILESQRGWVVCAEAANGEEAVQKTQELHPDLIILDISMPVLNGLDAARMIRKFCPETPILIVTLHRTTQLLEEVRQIGVRGFVAKSEASESLVKAVIAVLQNQTYFGAEKSKNSN